MNTRAGILAAVIPVFALAGCGDETPTGADHNDDEFGFTLTAAPEHFQTLSEVALTLDVRDHDGNAVMDFEEIHLETAIEESGDWDVVDLSPVGSVYEGTMVFHSAGEYEFRVMGMRHAGHEPGELHHVQQHFHVERAHADAGAYRVEYESFPGHVHEGDPVVLKFWVMDEDAGGAPVTGLSPQIRCSESVGSPHAFATVETAPGVYEANHTVTEAGDTRVALLFDGAGGIPAEAEFEFHTSHEH